MRIDLGANVRTKDGHHAGTVRKVVWDPERNEISEFVVSTGGLFGHDVLVGRDVLESATRHGDVIVIDMTKDELERMRPYDAARYTRPPDGWLAPVAYGYGMPSYLWPVAVVPPPVEPTSAPRHHELPAIGKGMSVKGPDGKTIGEVQELVLDEATGRLRSLVVRRSSALERLTGGGDTLEIPADQLDVGDGAVHVVGDRHAQRQPR